MTQTERLIDFLKVNGSIDPIQAWEQLGIYRLGARVFDAKKKGLNIITERKPVLNRFGESCEVGLYRLV